MVVNVRMLSYMNTYTVRPVTIPDRTSLDTLQGTLEDVFHYGQNEYIIGEHQDRIRKSLPSVSVGDVIEVHDVGNYVVCSLGFHKLDDAEYEAYQNITDRRNRAEYAYVKFQNDLDLG